MSEYIKEYKFTVNMLAYSNYLQVYTAPSLTDLIYSVIYTFVFKEIWLFRQVII